MCQICVFIFALFYFLINDWTFAKKRAQISNQPNNSPPKKANVFYIAMGYKIYIKYSVLPLEKFEFEPIFIGTKEDFMRIFINIIGYCTDGGWHATKTPSVF